VNETKSTSGLELRSLTKSFFGVQVLKSIDLKISPGQVLGLVGQNGAGKSTLMNIVGGNLQADSGEMFLTDLPYFPRTPRDAIRNGVGMVHQELNMFPNLSITENLFINNLPGFRRILEHRSIKRKATEQLRKVGLNLNPDWLVASLSVGQQQLVELARVVAADSHVLLLDEPTTSLSDSESRQFFRLTRELADEGRIVVLITHAIKDVLRHCDRVVVLRDGSLVAQEDTKQVDASWIVQRMVGRPVENLYPAREPMAIAKSSTSAASARDSIVLRVDKLSHPQTLFDVSFDLHSGEVLGIFGLMGAGRSELARVLMGLDPHASGKVLLESKELSGGPRHRCRLGVGLVTENRREDGILPESSIADNISLVAIDRFANRIAGLISQLQLKEAIRQTRQAVRMQSHLEDSQPLKTLSGGNQQKAILGKWMLNKCRVLILDEPTRGIDVSAKLEVYQWIHRFADEGNGALVISSELEELIGICDRILVMSLGSITGEFDRGVFSQEAILEAAFSRHGSRSSVGSGT